MFGVFEVPFEVSGKMLVELNESRARPMLGVFENPTLNFQRDQPIQEHYFLSVIEEYHLGTWKLLCTEVIHLQ